jgi:hypothetical protein
LSHALIPELCDATSYGSGDVFGGLLRHERTICQSGSPKNQLKG